MPAYKNERGTYYAKFRYIDWQGNKKQKKKEVKEGQLFN